MVTNSNSFSLKQESEKLTAVYLDPVLLKDYFTKARDSERYGIIRLWITEGIPFAFKDNPLLYEEIRSFIATGIGVHTKEVTIVGSGRTGYSLTKRKWGNPFVPTTSDLDFVIISNDLFKKLVIDFQKWVSDFHSRKTVPLDATQTRSWLNAIATVHRNIPKGYINTRQLFSNYSYPVVKQCNLTMRRLKDKIHLTPSAPSISDVSIRVYASWKYCIKQLDESFKVALIW